MFYFLLIMVIFNYVSNVLIFQGRDVIKMYHPMKLLLLSYNRINYQADTALFLIQVYPLLAVLPAGFSLVGEQQTGQEVMMIARLGNFTYKLSKLLAAFMATAIVFLAPSALELILNCLSFPLNATGDLINQSAYSVNYVENVNNYLFKGIYLVSPYIYAIAGTLSFGIFSGILGAFTVAFSSIVRVKYRAVLFLPVYLLLYAMVFLPELFTGINISTKWYSYLFIFNDEIKSSFAFLIIIFAIILFSVISTVISGGKECLR